MKFVVIFYTLFGVTTWAFAVPPTITGADAAEIQQIIDSIYHPSTDPATATALEEMLLEALGIDKAVIEDSESPLVVKPAIIDESIVSEPGQEQISPIDAEPAIIDESIVSEPANYRPVSVPEVIVIEQPEIPEEAVFDHIDVPEKVIIAEVPISV